MESDPDLFEFRDAISEPSIYILSCCIASSLRGLPGYWNAKP